MRIIMNLNLGQTMLKKMHITCFILLNVIQFNSFIFAQVFFFIIIQLQLASNIW